MPLPHEQFVIGQFLGAHEGIHSVALAEVFSSSGSKNVWMDKYARVRRILGYAAQNSSAVTSNVGGNAMKCVGLYGYRSLSGTTVTRVLIGIFDDGSDEWEIYKSADSGVTWTFLADIGSGPVGQLPDFSLSGANLIIATGGSGTPRDFNGTAVSAAGGTQSPTISVSTGAAGNLVGEYEWKLESVEADGDPHPSSVSSAKDQLEKRAGSLTWTADTDTDVVGYHLYRTTGTGKEFYHVTYIDGRTTASYTDDLPDSILFGRRPLENHGDAPPVCWLVELHEQRTWYGRTSANPRRAYYSDPNNYDSTWQDSNFIDFDDDRSMGDFLTGMLGNFEGRMVFFQERSIWTVRGTGAVVGIDTDWTIQRTSASIGAVSQQSLARVPAGAKYTDGQGSIVELSAPGIAFFTPHGDIRVFTGNTDIIVSDTHLNVLDDFNYSSRAATFVLHDDERSHITWFFAADGNTYPSEAVTWNYKYGVMYNSPTPASFACGVCTETSAEANLCLLGEAQTSKGGLVYEIWSGTSFNGSNISSAWFSKVLMGNVDNNAASSKAIHLYKRFSHVDLVLDAAAANQVTVTWYLGYADHTDTEIASGSVAVEAAAGIVQSTTDTITDASLNDILVSGITAQGRLYFLDGNGNKIVAQAARFAIEDDSQDGPWTLEAMSIDFQFLPGYKALID
jgi:hypothetical protein